MAKRKSLGSKIIRESNKLTLFLVCLFLLFGICIGAGVTFFITKNDTFIVNGYTEMVLKVNDVYTEEGAKVVAFGKDISNSVEIEGTVDTTKEGEYIIKYTVSNIRFRGYTLYRLVKVEAEV